MRVHTDDGSKLEAEFSVEAEGGDLCLFLESAGGKQVGSERARNADYVPALVTLLARLRDRKAVLIDVVLVSRPLSHLPEAERTALRGPRPLATVTDLVALRKEITTAQGYIGMPPGAKKAGNNSKRIRLRLTVPSYGPEDAERLAADLAAPAPDEVVAVVVDQVWNDANELLNLLVDIPLHTSTKQVNTVLSVEGDTARVATKQSPGGQPVPVADVQFGLDRLIADGSVPINVAALGHRSSFVGAVLAALPNAAFSGKPVRVVLGEAEGRKKSFASLDGRATVKVRHEQAYLRHQLMGKHTEGRCALCGDTYPKKFLVAAHIKKRAECSDDERNDFRHVAMLACALGCDDLYEHGWVTVDDTGTIHSGARDATGRLAALLELLEGRRCLAHGAESERYFAWHRAKYPGLV